MIFLYNFLFVVYFYSNKIWYSEKLVLQYTIKPIDFTGMSTHCVSLTPEIVYQASGRAMTDRTHEVGIS